MSFDPNRPYFSDDQQILRVKVTRPPVDAETLRDVVRRIVYDRLDAISATAVVGD